MDKVYIVTSGDYSDYHIEAVFSTREQALDYVDTKGSEYRIEEYPLDEPIEHNTGIWEVQFDYMSSAMKYAERKQEDSWYSDLIGTMKYNNTYEGDYIQFIVESDSMKRAIKVASERLHQVKTLQRIKFPYLTKKCIKNITVKGLCGDFPRYDFMTGKIILSKALIERLNPECSAPVEMRS